jgi:hypothetical protein
MKIGTDVTCNWILEEDFTKMSENKEVKQSFLKNLDNEISEKVKEFEKFNLKHAYGKFLTNGLDTISDNNIKKDIVLQNLPLYLPKQMNAKRISASLNHTQNTQRWIGYVISKTDKKFTARLEDITNPGTFEIGIFDIKDDASDEKEMIQIGAVFYLSVGYDVSRGTNAKQKLIRFQRLSEWTESDFDNALDRADRIASNLEWD